MKRVLHILGSLNRGGIENMLMNIYRNIDRSKLQFDFLLRTEEVCDFNNEVIEKGGKIYYCPPRNKGYFNARKSFSMFFSKHADKYVAVHYHCSSLTDLMPLEIAKNNNIKKRIIHSHNTRQGGGFIHKLLHYINRYRVERYATDFFACSLPAVEWFKGNNKNIVFKIINNSIDLDTFSYNQEKREEFRKKFSCEDKLVFGHVGRFHPQKNHLFLIDIFKEISKKNADAVLFIIGGGHKKLKEEVVSKVKLLNLSDKVFFILPTNEVASYMNMFDVFLFPSKYEGLGLVLIEAQSIGLPCFISKGRIPSEVKIKSNLQFLPLGEGAKYWAEKALSNLSFDRDQSLIVEAGYDIENTSKYLQEFYLQD